MTINQYITLKDIEKKLKISQISLRRYIKIGRLKASKMGREYKILPKEAEEFIKSFDENIPKNNLQEKAYIDSTKHLHHRSHPENSRGLVIFKGINSEISETLVEMLNERISIKEIRQIVSQYSKDILEIISRIEKEGVTDKYAAISLLLIDEAIKNLQTRRTLFTRLINNHAIVLLPLPPHLSDTILSVTRNELVLTSDDNLPPHLHKYNFRNIETFFDSKLIRPKSDIFSLVTEGYLENDKVYMRSNVVSFIKDLSRGGLKEIYIHTIPHIPPHSNFIEFDKRNFPDQVFKL